MNLLHDIPAGEPKGLINVVIEIPIGSNAKYEYHDDVKTIVLDRFLYTALTYPFNYGFIPQTWSEDHDALDIVVISSQSVATGTLIECRVIGMLATEDEEGGDAKLISVPKVEVDAAFSDVNTIDDLPEYLKNKIKHFYENYKSIEPGKWVKITGWLDKDDAVKVIEESIFRYKKNFNL
ncbi:inorganic diphosphatase [Candidatus Woesebacteria bacterium]|nr:inorganic diphosphatase [Candidatus Woesebacteria bacterium]